MTPRVCDEPDCERRHLARGLCGTHYARLYKAGAEMPPTEIPTPEENHTTVVTDPVGRIGNCAACGEGVPLLKSPSGYSLKCALFVRQRRSERNSRPEVKTWRRHYNRARKYGFRNVDAMWAALDAIGGKCEICDRELDRKSARFDHDHACCPGVTDRTCGGCIRGILCNACNSALGLFQDDPAIMRRAAAYVAQELRLTWDEGVA